MLRASHAQGNKQAGRRWPDPDSNSATSIAESHVSPENGEAETSCEISASGGLAPPAVATARPLAPDDDESGTCIVEIMLAGTYPKAVTARLWPIVRLPSRIRIELLHSRTTMKIG